MRERQEKKTERERGRERERERERETDRQKHTHKQSDTYKTARAHTHSVAGGQKVCHLQHTQSAADNGSVGEHKDGPSLLLGMRRDGLDEPVELLLVHGHLVGGVGGAAEGR